MYFLFSYATGGTNTYGAIKFTRVNVFNATNGMRSNAAKIAIIVTDGEWHIPHNMCIPLSLNVAVTGEMGLMGL
ncbi:MAG: VWA domain-containing protein [Sedimenticola sp.]